MTVRGPWRRKNVPPQYLPETAITWRQAAVAAWNDVELLGPENGCALVRGVVNTFDPRKDRYGNIPAPPLGGWESPRQAIAEKVRHGLWYLENLAIGASVGVALSTIANIPLDHIGILLPAITTGVQHSRLHENGTGIIGPRHDTPMPLRYANGIHDMEQYIHDAIRR